MENLMTHISESIGQTTFLAQCVTSNGRVLTIRDHGADPSDEAVAADCLDHVAVAAGDLVLALHVNVSNRPIVIGSLTGGRSHALQLPAGYSAEMATNGLVLKNPQGGVVLEIETVGASPKLKVGEDDLSIDLTGRLRIAARSIDLQARLGNVNVEANDDVVLLGERVRLN